MDLVIGPRRSTLPSRRSPFRRSPPCARRSSLWPRRSFLWPRRFWFGFGCSRLGSCIFIWGYAWPSSINVSSHLIESVHVAQHWRLRKPYCFKFHPSPIPGIQLNFISTNHPFWINVTKLISTFYAAFTFSLPLVFLLIEVMSRFLLHRIHFYSPQPGNSCLHWISTGWWCCMECVFILPLICSICLAWNVSILCLCLLVLVIFDNGLQCLVPLGKKDLLKETSYYTTHQCLKDLRENSCTMSKRHESHVKWWWWWEWWWCLLLLCSSSRPKALEEPLDEGLSEWCPSWIEWDGLACCTSIFCNFSSKRLMVCWASCKSPRTETLEGECCL